MDCLGSNAVTLAGAIGRTNCSTPLRTRYRLYCRVVLIACAILLLSLLPAIARAANISVCASGCDQTTIASAIAAANSGDTITIGAGTYPFNVEISKNLTSRGAVPRRRFWTEAVSAPP